MNALVFAPLFNTHLCDATGAFQPEAHAFCKAHDIVSGVKLFKNDMPYPARLTQVIDWIEAAQPNSIDTIAFFNHGWKTGLQFGVSVKTAAAFAEAMKKVATRELRVLLYACTTGSDNDGNDGNDKAAGPGGEGGMADALRDALVKAGLRATIFAHATVGHCTTNPWVRRFNPDEMAGGDWVVEPHSELWARWCHRLDDGRTDFRFRFPFLTQGELEFELRGLPGAVA